jgi:NADH-quinone oxidoreductase subunit N
MNASLLLLEFAVAALGIGVLLVDLWTPQEQKRSIGFAAAAALAMVLLASFSPLVDPGVTSTAFGGAVIQDALSLFFKRFFLVAGVVVLLMAQHFADRLTSAVGEFYALLLFALSGMMLAASANDLILLFVSLELITVTFYILVGFQRGRIASLEAGVKYLILGAAASAFMVFGMAFIFGTANTTSLPELAGRSAEWACVPMFKLGVLLLLVGLGFKIAAFPFQFWAPDVYQGAPTPVAAFLAIGSKAAGFVLVLRLFLTALPELAQAWEHLLLTLSGITILYGSLCAIPQRNLKRLLGYSSIANAGYLLMGVATGTSAGAEAVVYYLLGYMFTVLTAFCVLCVVSPAEESADISVVSGLGRRSPWLGAALALSMVSLAGIPPMAGFFGKFMLLKAALAQGATNPAFYTLLAIALAGVVISLYYYFNVIRAIYWEPGSAGDEPILISRPFGWAFGGCVAGMLVIGLWPGPFIGWARTAASALFL